MTVLVVAKPLSSQPVIVSRIAPEGCEEGEDNGAAEEEGVDAGNVCEYVSRVKGGGWRGGEKRLRTAAELAGTIFPDEVMTHPLGMPATEV